MARLMIRCPQTGKPVFTGMDMPPAAFDRATLESNTVRCPHCGEPHTWQKADAYLEES
jgi:endogenous inhibitor of DNA gyrase (YacG/DUF329 family)